MLNKPLYTCMKGYNEQIGRAHYKFLNEGYIIDEIDVINQNDKTYKLFNKKNRSAYKQESKIINNLIEVILNNKYDKHKSIFRTK